VTVPTRKIDLVSEHASPLADPGGPDAGGQNVHVRALAEALARAGHDVTVWTRRDDAGLPPTVTTDAGVRVRHLDAGPPVPLPKDELVPHVPAMAHALGRAWRADRPDVVHAHFWMSGLAALTAARDLDVPTVQTFHALGTVKRRHQGDADSSPPGRIRAECCLARQVDRVVATCNDEVDELVRMGAPRARTEVVPCGVDTAEFTPAGPAAPRGALRRLVSLGRLVRRKGVDEAVLALTRVPDTELVVAGGTGDDDPDRARLAALAERVRVRDRVRFVGPVSRADAPALLRSADAVVCVPWYEPFGMVPLEAMACARPVVASAVGGLADTVVDGVTGVHVPPRDPRALAVALRRLLASPATAEAFGTAGRERAEVRYGWAQVAAATAAVYEQVLQVRAPLGAAS
jgi:D-inositol-3-phosphate glycosyltransferase